MEEAGRNEVAAQAVDAKSAAVVEVNGHKFIANGRWNTDAVAAYVITDATATWMKIGELARFAHASNTIQTKKRVRARINELFMNLVEKKGCFLAVATSDGVLEQGRTKAVRKGSAVAVKIADSSSAYDMELVDVRIRRMQKRQELTERQYAAVMALRTKEANIS